MPERELGACARESRFSASDARNLVLTERGWRCRSTDGSRVSPLSSVWPQSVGAALFGRVATTVSANHLIDPRTHGSDHKDVV
jgi:hypothetical protein